MSVNPITRRQCSSIILSLLAILSLLLAAVTFTGRQPNSPELLRDSARWRSLDVSQNRTIMRQRTVEINFEALHGLRPGSSVQLNLFNDTLFTAVVDQVKETAQGQRVWSGSLPGVQFGSFVLVEGGGQVVGNITAFENFYQVRYAGNGAHAVYQINQGAFPSELDPVPVDATAQPGRQPGAPTDDGSVIDVMVAYTTAARTGAGGATAIQNLINLAVEETNQAYQNSGITQRLNLVHTVEVSYSETGDLGTDLSRLRAKDGYMDEVHGLRDTYYADMVSLIVHDGGDYCGMAYLMTSVSLGFAGSAFSVVARECATGYYSFGHELGHNMAARHDWYVDGTAYSPYSYNHGYVNDGPTAHWRTIMAYNTECTAQGFSCTRIKYFANPSVSYGGIATGVDAGTSVGCLEGQLSHPACDADNRLTFNNTAWTVANFRVGAVLPGAFNKIAPLNGAGDAPLNPALSWGSSSDAVSYEYCYDTSDDDACTSPATWSSVGANTGVNLSGLADGTVYYWQVRARNADGTTSADGGAWWSFATQGPPGAFGKSWPVDGATGSALQALLGWDDSPFATSYEYCYDTTDDNACDTWFDASAHTSVLLTGLEANTTYYWQARAFSSQGMAYADGAGDMFWSFTTGEAADGVVVYLVRILR